MDTHRKSEGQKDRRTESIIKERRFNKLSENIYQGLYSTFLFLLFSVYGAPLPPFQFKFFLFLYSPILLKNSTKPSYLYLLKIS